ncbi:MAG: hypothetical protein ACR2PS_03090 [Pseudomonadales bacterium]
MNTYTDRSTQPTTLTFDQVTKHVDVPLLGIGHLMFDGTLHPLAMGWKRE